MRHLGTPHRYGFEGADGRNLIAEVYTDPTRDSFSDVVVALVHGAGGDRDGNGNPYVQHLMDVLPLQGVDVATLQRGGQDEKGYAGGQPGGSSHQTLKKEVADTRAGFEALASLGYERIVPVGFSIGELLTLAVVSDPSFHASIAPAGVKEIIGASGTRVNTWMGMADPELHEQTLERANLLVSEGKPHELVTTNHKPYGFLWEAGAYASMSGEAADPSGYMHRVSEQGVALVLAYGTADPDVSGSWGGIDSMRRLIWGQSPEARFVEYPGAPHNLAGFERQFGELVLSVAKPDSANPQI